VAADLARVSAGTRHLSLSQTLDDRWHLQGLLTPTDGTTLAVALEALAGKRGGEDDRSITQRRADALIELAELGLRSAELPDCGGDRPRVTLLLHASSNPFTHRLADASVTGPEQVQISVTGFNRSDAQLLASTGCAVAVAVVVQPVAPLAVVVLGRCNPAVRSSPGRACTASAANVASSR
jgi:hypothetical protein